MPRLREWTLHDDGLVGRIIRSTDSRASTLAASSRHFSASLGHHGRVFWSRFRYKCAIAFPLTITAMSAEAWKAHGWARVVYPQPARRPVRSSWSRTGE